VAVGGECLFFFNTVYVSVFDIARELREAYVVRFFFFNLRLFRNSPKLGRGLFCLLFWALLSPKPLLTVTCILFFYFAFVNKIFSLIHIPTSSFEVAS